VIGTAIGDPDPKFYEIRTDGNNPGTSYPDFNEYGIDPAVGDVVGILLDLDGGTISFTLNGVDEGIAYSDVSGNFCPQADIEAHRGSTNVKYWNFAYVTAQDIFAIVDATHEDVQRIVQFKMNNVVVGNQYGVSLGTTTFTGDITGRTLPITVTNEDHIGDWFTVEHWVIPWGPGNEIYDLRQANQTAAWMAIVNEHYSSLPNNNETMRAYGKTTTVSDGLGNIVSDTFEWISKAEGDVYFTDPDAFNPFHTISTEGAVEEAVMTANFGATPWTYDPPEGYKGWCDPEYDVIGDNDPTTDTYIDGFELDQVFPLMFEDTEF
jgi:hypothetical protein